MRYSYSRNGFATRILRPAPPSIVVDALGSARLPAGSTIIKARVPNAASGQVLADQHQPGSVSFLKSRVNSGIEDSTGFVEKASLRVPGLRTEIKSKS